MSLQVIYHQTNEQLNQLTLTAFETEYNRLSASQDTVVVAITGGRSVQGLFSLLPQARIDWSKLVIFMVDERMVAIDQGESNFFQAKQLFINQLLERGVITSKQLHPFDYRAGIEAYETELKTFGGKYDILVLGVGEDGHVAGLYPDHHSSANSSEYFITFNDSPKPPSARMSSSLQLLKRAEVAFGFFIGEDKRHAYELFVNPALSVEQCPAKVLMLIPQSFIVTNLTV